MVWRKTIVLVTAITLGIGAQFETNVAQAGVFDMMSPSKWFGNNDRDSHDRGYGPGYNRGGGGPYGWGGGPYGWGGGGPYGWGGGGPYGWGGGGPYGWGGGPYGGGYPGYYGHPYQTAPATEKSAPRLPE